MTPVVKTALDFMRRRLVELRENTKMIDGVARLLKDNISGAPVADENGNYQGVFSEKCCMNAMTEVVDAAGESDLRIERARDFMTSNLVTLTPDIDVFDAIDHILSKRISGAPVLDENKRFLGIFSEKTAMQVLIAAGYDRLPGTNVGAYMNTDRNRIIREQDSLLQVAHKFQQTPYRRLPVLVGDQLVGQVSRRDVLRAELRLTKLFVETASVQGNEHALQAACAEVGDYMDCLAKTIHPSADLLMIAQVFLNSPYRRLPVVDGDKLVGQVSRRDLLSAAAEQLRPQANGQLQNSETLYLSGLSDERPPSFG